MSSKELIKLEKLLSDFKQIRNDLKRLKVNVVDGKVLLSVEDKEENSSQTNTNQSLTKTEK